MSLTTSPTKRQQVINEITENIRRGILEPGTRLATVRDMSAHFDVSLSVIQNALRELTDNGFVECRGASGFYVRETPAESREKRGHHIAGWSSQVARRAHNPKVASSNPAPATKWRRSLVG